MEGSLYWFSSLSAILAINYLRRRRRGSDLSDREWDCVIIGAGLSGLNAAHELVHKHGANAQKILILDAQSYIGGRVKQTSCFVPGMTIDLGAEIIHGSCTSLNKFAERIGEETLPVFVWAHGDGGPLDQPVNGGYGIYYLKDKSGATRLLRFDDEDKDFVNTNNLLHNLSDNVDITKTSKELCLSDYLKNEGIDPSGLMSKMVHAGFSNTMCTNNLDMSLFGMTVWKKAWDEEDGDEADYRFKNSYKCLIDYFKTSCERVSIRLRHSVDKVRYISGDEKTTAGVNEERVCIEMRNSDSPVDGEGEDNRDSGWGDTTVLKAKSAIVTVPLPVLASGRLALDPPLSEQESKDLYGNTQIFPAMKVLLSFQRRCWPAGLHGTIMAGEGLLVPEAWFREMEPQMSSPRQCEEPQPRCYATGFLTADFARGLLQAAKEEVALGTAADVDEAMCRIFLRQLDEVFACLEERHMGPAVMDRYSEVDNTSTPERAVDLPVPSSVYCAGMVYRWDPDTHPFIRGGYSSVKAGAYSLTEEPAIIAQGKGGVFFAGEGTAVPGCTAHSALDTGARAARQVAAFLAA